MTSVLPDTHAWTWSLTGDERLLPPCPGRYRGGRHRVVSPITSFEIAQKVRIGKWPEMVGFIDQLPGLLHSQGGVVAAFGPAICLEAGMMDWGHRDPFDRLLAATARQGTHLLVSADAVFDRVVSRVW